MPGLSVLFVRSAPPGKHEDGKGLRRVKRQDGGGQWVFCDTIHERRREMGIGGFASLSLKDAREIPALKRETASCSPRCAGASSATPPCPA